jgi:hypothetical protein
MGQTCNRGLQRQPRDGASQDEHDGRLENEDQYHLAVGSAQGLHAGENGDFFNRRNVKGEHDDQEADRHRQDRGNQKQGADAGPLAPVARGAVVKLAGRQDIVFRQGPGQLRRDSSHVRAGPALAHEIGHAPGRHLEKAPGVVQAGEREPGRVEKPHAGHESNRDGPQAVDFQPTDARLRDTEFSSVALSQEDVPVGAHQGGRVPARQLEPQLNARIKVRPEHLHRIQAARSR